MNVVRNVCDVFYVIDIIGFLCIFMDLVGVSSKSINDIFIFFKRGL